VGVLDGWMGWWVGGGLYVSVRVGGGRVNE